MIAVYYLKTVLPAVQAAARACGYAVGLHGSLARDLDLIAAPWTVEATDAATLVEAVRVAVCGHVAERNDGLPWPREKPHGRLCWSIQLGAGAYIDLSVMPAVE